MAARNYLRKTSHMLATAGLLLAAPVALPGVTDAAESQRKLVYSETDLASQFYALKRPEFERHWIDIHAPDARLGDARANGYISVYGTVRDDRDLDGSAEEYLCHWDVVLKTTYKVGEDFYFRPQLVETVRRDCWIGSDDDRWGLVNWGLGDWWTGVVAYFRDFKPIWDQTAILETLAFVNYHSDGVELVLLHFGEVERKMLQKMAPDFKMMQGIIKK